MRMIALSLLCLASACGGNTTISTPPAPPANMTGKAVDAADDKHDAKGHDHDHHGKAEPVGAFQPLSNADAKVFFVEPTDGATVKSPVKVVFGVEGASVIPAGQMAPDSGHHHVIIDGEAPEAGVAVAKDATHIHYGGGQTEAALELAPGEHTLVMQFADFAHRSYGPALTATIKVTVEE